MNKKTTRSTFLEKLENSSLFLTYRDAFEVATGYRLTLWQRLPSAEPGDLSVSVPVGRTFPLDLLARPMDGSGCDGENIKLCTRGLLQAFARQLGAESNRAMLESGHADTAAVVRAKDFIHGNIGSKIQLNDVAAAAGACSFQLCRIFKRDTGITMTEYISRRRVERAKILLRNPYLQVAEIADQVGFTSLSQFSRNFLKYAGESPTEFRQRLKELEHCDLAAI
jgi:AraC-like DNA-binding protein